MQGPLAGAWSTVTFGAAIVGIQTVAGQPSKDWISIALLVIFLARVVQFYSGNIKVFLRQDQLAGFEATTTPTNRGIVLFQGLTFVTLGMYLTDPAAFLRGLAIFLIADAIWLVANQLSIIYHSCDVVRVDTFAGGAFFPCSVIRRVQEFSWLPLKWAVNNVAAGAFVLACVTGTVVEDSALALVMGTTAFAANAFLDFLWTAREYMAEGLGE